MLELRARLVVGELPVDAGLGRIPVVGPSLCLVSEGFDIRDSAAQTLFGEDAQLDLGDIQPAAMLGRVVDLQAIEQAACFSPSRIGSQAGRSRFLRSKAASNPCSTKRWRILNTVRGAPPNTSPACSSSHAGPLASTFNNTLACLIFCAEATPLLTKASNATRSSSVSRTIYFLFIRSSLDSPHQEIHPTNLFLQHWVKRGTRV